MKKIKVVRLGGCHWCESLTSQLNELEIQYESIDADENGSLADSLEDLLNTNYYPIVIIETPTIFYYLYRPSDAKDAGYTTLNNKATKIGCLTLSAFVTQIKQLI